MKRREFMMLSGSVLLMDRPSWSQVISTNRSARVSSVIEQYSRQGYHRTGSTTDLESGTWLANQVRRIGAEPLLTRFSVPIVEPVRGQLRVGERVVKGLPMFDCSYTASHGTSGRLGGLDSRADIGVGQLPPLWVLPGASEFQEARRHGAFRALIAICDGEAFGIPPGLTPANASYFQEPFGPPVLQVSSTEGSWLLEAARKGTEATLIAEATRKDVEVFNVEVRIKGETALNPLVIMTPRSGWWHCASERGGGLACWLEILRVFAEAKPHRDVWFVATTGHELGHLGLKHFLSEHRDLIRSARAWIHLGANFAASQDPSTRFQFSDKELETLALESLRNHGVRADLQTPVGDQALGEAGNIHDGGGRYVSLLGRNGLFHHVDERWPEAVDIEKTVRIIDSFTEISRRLAS